MRSLKPHVSIAYDFNVDILKICIFPSTNALDARLNLSRWLLAAARMRGAGDAAAGRLPLGRIEFHTESGLRILLARTAHSHAD